MVSARNIEQVIALALLFLVAIGCFVVLQPFLTAILWAILLSFATWPLHQRMVRLFGQRTALAALTMTASIAALVLLPIVTLGGTIAGDVPHVAQLVRGWLEHGPPDPPEAITGIPLVGPRLYARWAEMAHDGAQLSAALTPYITDARQWLLAALQHIGAAAGQLIIALVIAFFLYCYGGVMAERLKVSAQRLAGTQALALIEIAATTVRGVVYGLLGTNLVEAILAALGFRVAGVPGAFFLGFLCFFLTVIPMGPAIIWVPAVIWLASAGETASAIALAVWNILVFAVLEPILRPLLMVRGGDLPLVVLLLGMLGGLVAFGFLGLFLGPTFLAIGYTLVAQWSVPAIDSSSMPEEQRERSDAIGRSPPPAIG